MSFTWDDVEVSVTPSQNFEVWCPTCEGQVEVRSVTERGWPTVGSIMRDVVQHTVRCGKGHPREPT